MADSKVRNFTTDVNAKYLLHGYNIYLYVLRQTDLEWQRIKKNMKMFCNLCFNANVENYDLAF